ncbi:DNA-binding protein RFX8 [Rhynchonycteris naso]
MKVPRDIGPVFHHHGEAYDNHPSSRLVDNFCLCEGCSVPHCLMYEIHKETFGQNSQNQVNPAKFRKVGYHYDGICIKKNSFIYAQYCYQLGEKRYHSGDVVASEKSTNYDSIIQQDITVSAE